MPNKKTLKAAEKALVKAKDAVADAKRSVKKLDKATRRKADALELELKNAKKSAQKSIRRAERTASKRTADAAQAGGRKISVPKIGAAESAAVAPKPASSGAEAAPTYRELRELAKSQGVPGYSRMNKASLVAALSRS